MIEAAAVLPVLDEAHFAMMTAGDAVLQSEVAELFRSQAPEWRAALDAPGNTAWFEALHKLKGSARGIGFAELAAFCEAAERTSLAEAPSASARVLAALENALHALAPY